MLALPPDIQARVRRDFPQDAEAVLSVLRTCAESFGVGERVLRCVVHLAAGDRGTLEHYLARAEQDWRDVVYWAEYDKDEHRVRDFRLPFDVAAEGE